MAGAAAPSAPGGEPAGRSEGEILDPQPPRPLLEHRLVIVTGKGGTGKTSVAASLALAAARDGRRVLIAEVGPDEHVPRLLDPKAPSSGYAGREVVPGVHTLRIDPYQALAEYLSLQIGVRSLFDFALRNKAFRQLMDASPGWRELITLGKVWHLGEQRDAAGRALYDLILVDAPATGHGLTFLDVPRVVVSAVRAGPLHLHAGWIEDMLKDPQRTLLLPVALAEELPVRETEKLVEHVRELGIAVDRVVVNAVVEEPFPPGVPDLDERLARLPAEALGDALPSPAVLACSAAYLRARHEQNERWRSELGRETQLPLVSLPYLAEGVSGTGTLHVLARALCEPPRAVAA